MEAFISKMIAVNKKRDPEGQGFPAKKDSLLPPQGATYAVNVNMLLRPRAKAGSKTFLFMRAGSVEWAVEWMKDHNDYPVLIKALNSDLGHDWGNVPYILWKFWVLYCYAEGLQLSGEMAEKVQQYIFYGTYPFKRSINKVKTIKHKDIVHGLHFKLVAHRSRFLKNVDACFKTFMELCEEHPQWKVQARTLTKTVTST